MSFIPVEESKSVRTMVSLRQPAQVSASAHRDTPARARVHETLYFKGIDALKSLVGFV